MTTGNLLALNQTDLRYILSYSSVAQMGYILLGFGIGLIYNLPLPVSLTRWPGYVLIGIGQFAVYYVIFRTLVVKLNLIVALVKVVYG